VMLQNDSGSKVSCKSGLWSLLRTRPVFGVYFFQQAV
jgi:hypothetical protein